MDEKNTAVQPSSSVTDSEKRRQQRIRAASKYADENNHPCLKESTLSMNCMNEHDFDREKCSLYFQNYRNCLDFWKRVSSDRRRSGIKPHLPPPEDRERIRMEYYNKSAYKERK